MKVYEAARKLGIPVIVHTGNGVPQALPPMMISTAQQYPDLPIVLAHSESWAYFDEALLTAKPCDNIFLEMSTAGTIYLEIRLNKLGASKMMFDSDGELNVGPELQGGGIGSA